MIDTSVIKESLVLSDVVADTVQVIRSRSNPARWSAKCCFHQDRNPSLVGDDATGHWRCYGCGERGDLIDFIRLRDGVDFKEAANTARVLAGIGDRFMTAEQRAEYELRLKRKAEERQKVRKWKHGIVLLLQAYISVQWSIHRQAKRQLLKTYTEELEQQAEIAAIEAEKKEAALEQLEEMSQDEVVGYWQTRKTWQGKLNPPWWLSSKKLQVAQSAGKV